MNENQIMERKNRKEIRVVLGRIPGSPFLRFLIWSAFVWCARTSLADLAT